MDREQRKEYNKKYYESHKETIIKTACEKIFCDKCGRSVIRNNIKSHQKSKICARHSQNKVAISIPNEPTDLNLIEFNDENLKVLMEKLHNYLESKKETTPDIQDNSKESDGSDGSETSNNVDFYTFEIVSVKDRIKKINDKIL